MGERSAGRKLYSALMFVFVSVLGGVLTAGLVVPTAGIAAELAKTGGVLLLTDDSKTVLEDARKRGWVR